MIPLFPSVENLPYLLVPERINNPMDNIKEVRIRDDSDFINPVILFKCID